MARFMGEVSQRDGWSGIAEPYHPRLVTVKRRSLPDTLTPPGTCPPRELRRWRHGHVTIDRKCTLLSEAVPAIRTLDTLGWLSPIALLALGAVASSGVPYPRCRARNHPRHRILDFGLDRLRHRHLACPRTHPTPEGGETVAKKKAAKKKKK
jgi:hypothetical protein